jgi:hypothetical protein
MNKQIYELAKQAGLIEFEAIPGSKAVTPTYESIVRAQTFAELIVRQCAGIAKKEQAFNAQYTDANMHPQVNIDQCILMGFGL